MVIRDRGIAYLWVAHPCAPTRKDQRDHQPPQGFKNVTEVETSPVQSNLCTLLITLPTAVPNSHKDCARKSNGCGEKKNLAARQSIWLWEPSSTSLLLISAGLWVICALPSISTGCVLHSLRGFSSVGRASDWKAWRNADAGSSR